MPKRILQGTVVSSVADKTITVLVERREKHPVLGKIVRKSKKFMAHDESNKVQKGDVVRIQECRPISKHKAWEVIGQDGQDKEFML